jgi:hypothetical protein
MGEAVNRLEWRVIWELGFMEQGMGVKGIGQSIVWQWSRHSHGVGMAKSWNGIGVRVEIQMRKHKGD